MSDRRAHLLAVFALCCVYFTDGQSRKIVCYYANWSQFRPGRGRFVPANIDASLCTHLIYAFADISDDNGIVQRESPNLYTEFQATKQRNPALKTLLGIGGYSAGVRRFQNVARSANRTAAFAQNAIQYLRSLGFDGMDIDWEYPVIKRVDGERRDRIDFTHFLRAIYQAFLNEPLQGGQERLLLSAAIFAYPTDAYELNHIGNHLDFVNILSYDIEGSWMSETGMNAPLPDVADSVREFIEGGVAPSKLVLGLAAYGRSWTLANSQNTVPDSAAVGPGAPGRYTQEGGFLAYYEICTNIQQNGWARAWWPETSTPYAYSGLQYVGYDDIQSLAYKAGLIDQYNLGGGMVWTVDLDDFGDECGGGRYPLLTAINDMLDGTFTFPTTTVDPRTTISTISTTIGTRPTPVTCNYEAFCANRGDRIYRDPCSCTRFVRCFQNRVPAVQVCPSGLVFNQITQRCDWKDNVPECNFQQTTRLTTQTTQTTTPTPLTTTPTQQTTVPGGGSILDRFCESRGPGRYRNPESCNSYLVCLPGRNNALLQPCPAGTAFNGQVCDFAYNVPGCGLSPGGGRFCNSRIPGIYRNPDSCSTYLVCVRGLNYAVELSCDVGLVFNGQACDYPENVPGCGVQACIGGALDCVPTCIGGALDYVPTCIGGALDYLSAYIGGVLNYVPTCIGGALDYLSAYIGGALNYVLTCIGGALDCVPACIGGALDCVPTCIGGRLDYVPTSIGGALDYLPTCIGVALGYVPTCIGGALELAPCPADVPALLTPHETHCRDYYICSYGIRTRFTCPLGTLYNIPTRRCEFPFNVNCIGRPQRF